MVLHSSLNGKGQFNIGFVIAVILFTFLAILIVMNILDFVPGSKDRIDTVNLQSTAYNLNEIMIDGPGLPVAWTSSPTRVGFAEYSSYSGLTVPGSLDKVKVDHVEASMAYSDVKSGLGLPEEIDFRLLITDGSTIHLDLVNNSIPTTSNSITIQRIASMNKTKVDVVLTVWN